MKRIFVIPILILVIPVIVSETFAQPFQGKRYEFSTSASFLSTKYKGAEESNTVFNLSLRLGYFIFKGLEIEPELVLTIPDESENTGYFFMGNLAYNFKTSEKMAAFILAGAGYGNGLRIFSWVMDGDTGVTALNFGAGIKYLISESAALRIEYRLTKYSGEKTHTGYYANWSEVFDRTDNSVLLGLSVFF
jgi:opacity protein-like surface antigen